jgi:hypothetical protein
MKTLELFSGTQSFSKAVIRNGGSAVTIDILKKFNPTICADILTWDYKVYPVGYFDVIWCSPPCTEYSKAKTRGVRNLTLADSLVKKCFEIIDYLKPKHWILENVGTGLLVNRMKDIRDGLEPQFADYCPYGKPYRKRTVFWSDIKFDFKLCKGPGVCSMMDGNKHKNSCGNGTKTYCSKMLTVWEKDAIPEGLVEYIYSNMNMT